MINILIVDDSATKVGHINAAIVENPSIDNSKISIASDCVSARRELSGKQFDLLILDLNLPERFGDEPKNLSGIGLLEELIASKRLCKPFHIIGLTQYDELIEDHRCRFEDDLWVLIHFDEKSTDWKNKLKNKIKYLVQSKMELSRTSDLEYNFDIAIITALHEPELEMVLRLDAGWENLEIPNDPSQYYSGTFTRGTKRLKVVAASSNQMGMPAAAVLSMKIIDNFRPRYLIMSGISAGLRDKCNLGDLLACDLSWDYGSGKISCDKEGVVSFSPDPKSIPLDPAIKESLLAVRMAKLFLDDIKNLFPGNTPDTSLQVVIGPVASGAAVVENSHLIEEIRNHNRKLIGIEMEAYGVFYAANNAKGPRPIPISIKSACDFADMNKDDDFQRYAAFTSAEYIYRFCLECFE